MVRPGRGGGASCSVSTLVGGCDIQNCGQRRRDDLPSRPMSEPLLTPWQGELLDKARRLAVRFAARAEAHDREGSFPFEDFADLHREGYLALPLPADLGGAGFSIHDFCLAQEQLARGSGPTALGVGMHLYNLGGGFDLFSESFRRRVAAAVIGEGALVASSISEPGASLGSPQVTARKVEGGYRVSGRKYFCTLAPILRWFLFNAKLEGCDRPGVSGTVTLAAERGSEGMRVIETWDAMGMRATGSHDIEFSDAFVPQECLVGEEGAGVRGRAAGVCRGTRWGSRRSNSESPAPPSTSSSTTRSGACCIRGRGSIAHLPGVQFDVAEMSIAARGGARLRLQDGGGSRPRRRLRRRAAAAGHGAAVLRHAHGSRRRHPGHADRRRPEPLPAPPARAPRIATCAPARCTRTPTPGCWR